MPACVWYGYAQLMVENDRKIWMPDKIKYLLHPAWTRGTFWTWLLGQPREMVRLAESYGVDWLAADSKQRPLAFWKCHWAIRVSFQLVGFSVKSNMNLLRTIEQPEDMFVVHGIELRVPGAACKAMQIKINPLLIIDQECSNAGSMCF